MPQTQAELGFGSTIFTHSGVLLGCGQPKDCRGQSEDNMVRLILKEVTVHSCTRCALCKPIRLRGELRADTQPAHHVQSCGPLVVPCALWSECLAYRSLSLCFPEPHGVQKRSPTGNPGVRAAMVTFYFLCSPAPSRRSTRQETKSSEESHLSSLFKITKIDINKNSRI